MTSHNMFNVGKACLVGTVLTAPAPLVATLVTGRAGLTVLLPVGLAAAAIGLLGTHGTDMTDCPDCMDGVTRVLIDTPALDESAEPNTAMVPAVTPEYAALGARLTETSAGRDFADRYAAHCEEYPSDVDKAA